ncbi:MAG: hypothetical protein K0S11_1019, partial [Gammaproteobacteria bacterium]|nr:hypothetical protein [Gammaproteobacteria bacterium]
ELMRTIIAIPLTHLLRLFSQWQEQKNNRVDISPLLPKNLKDLESQVNENYIKHILEIRQKHLNALSHPGNNPNLTTKEQNQLLQNAIDSDEQAIVELLFPNMDLQDNGQNFKALAAIKGSKYKILSQKKLFFAAIEIGETEQVENLIKIEPLLAGCLTFRGDTPVMLAIKYDKAAIVQLLVENGADLSGGLSIYASAKEYAENQGKSHLVQLISDAENTLVTSRPTLPPASNPSGLFYPKKSKEAKLINAIEYYPTKGGGQCFFHAAFGEMVNDLCQVNEPQRMRNEWHRYLNQFHSLADPNMPIALSSQLEKILEYFLENPSQASSVFHATTAHLREAIKQRLDSANEEAHMITGELISLIQTNPEKNLTLVKKLLFNILTREQIDRVKDTIRLLLGYALSEHIDEQELNTRLDEHLQDTKIKQTILYQVTCNTEYLKQRLHEDLRNYVLLFKPDEYSTAEVYDQKLNSQVILREFLNNPVVYQAYLAAIKYPSYYIFMEEIPIIASLSHTTIHVWYQERQGQYIKQTFNPDPLMMHWLEDDINAELPWDNINEVEIHHSGFDEQGLSAGLHFSQVNRQQLANEQDIIQSGDTIKPVDIAQNPGHEPEPAQPTTAEETGAKKAKRFSEGIGVLSVVAFIFILINSILSIAETSKLYKNDPSKIDPSKDWEDYVIPGLRLLLTAAGILTTIAINIFGRAKATSDISKALTELIDSTGIDRKRINRFIQLNRGIIGIYSIGNTIAFLLALSYVATGIAAIAKSAIKEEFFTSVSLKLAANVSALGSAVFWGGTDLMSHFFQHILNTHFIQPLLKDDIIKREEPQQPANTELLGQQGLFKPTPKQEARNTNQQPSEEEQSKDQQNLRLDKTP